MRHPLPARVAADGRLERLTLACPGAGGGSFGLDLFNGPLSLEGAPPDKRFDGLRVKDVDEVSEDARRLRCRLEALPDGPSYYHRASS